MTNHQVYIGTSGFYYNDWLNIFYPRDLPKGDWLKFYVQHFKTLEINASFYRNPILSTTQRWKKLTSADFIFSFKASKYITHVNNFRFKEKTLDLFLKSLSFFAQLPPLHLILFQLPQFLEKNLEQLASLLQLLPATFLYAFEFRHNSWFDEDVYALLRKYNVAVVLSDSPRRDNGTMIWPSVDVKTADFSYMRFHGPVSLYNSSYTDEVLKKYSDLIKKKVQERLKVYCYFNNDFQGYAIKNAQRLWEMIGL